MDNSSPDFTRISELNDRFETKLREGASPAIEAFLRQIANTSREALFRQLLLVEVEYRIRNGEQPQGSDYNIRFPDYQSTIEEVFQSEFTLPVPSGNTEQIGCTSDPRRVRTSQAADSASRHRVIDRYKLLQKLGEGGMGEVWMAEQSEPVRRRVALKLIRSGVNTDQIIARFEAERQALAMMDHRCIARVLDAGQTVDGMPYFVMELVQGIPITEYCDKNCLSIIDRLRLFMQVCHAVQHAHQKGIIHRDLKPSNVLVCQYDGSPEPKVIDFGLAKATEHTTNLTEKTMFTEFGQVVGTVRYMSPEQAEMNQLSVDTRTDIYSLGVLLYELLTGTTPIEVETLKKQALLKVLELIREDEPPLPSLRLSTSKKPIEGISKQRQIDTRTLQRILKGDLDWIVMKALEKDRDRRYATAIDFAEDINRYSQNDAVSARPPTFRYRASKLFRKHRPAVLTGLTVLGLLIAGIVSTSVLYIRASKAERDIFIEKVAAESSADSARQAERRALGAETAAKRSEAVAIEKSRQLADALREADGRLARSNYFLGIARFNENRAELALQSINAVPVRFRDFEWGFAKQKVVGGKMTLSGHRYAAKCVATSPSGTKIASAGEGGRIRIWDVVRGKELRVLKAHNHRIESLAFSPDGKALASASWDKTVKIWNAQSGKLIQVYSQHSVPVTSVAFSPDGKIVASASRGLFVPESLRRKRSVVEKKGEVHVWDLETMKTIHSLSEHTNHVHDVVFSPDGNILASSGMEILLWDAESGELKTTLDGHEFHVVSVAFSPDGKRLVSAGDRGQTAIVWDVNESRQLHTLRGHNEFLTDASFSPDGSMIATASADRTIRIWDRKTAKPLRVLKGHQDWVNAVAFRPSDGELVSASRDCNLKLWDLRVTDERHSIDCKGAIKDLAWCEATEHFVIAGPGTNIQVRSLRESKPPLTIFTNDDRQVSCVAISEDGSRVASGGWERLVRLWNASSGEILHELQTNTDSSISDIAFSPDGRLVATAGSVVDIWDADTGEHKLTFDKHHEHVFAVEFASEGRQLATGGADQTVKLWDPLTGTVHRTFSGLPFWVSDIAFSPSCKSIAITSSGEVTQWSVSNGKKLGSFRHDGVRRIVYVNESRLVSANDASGDSTLKIWDVRNGDELLSLNGHRFRINALAYSRHRNEIFSCADDKTVKFWRAQVPFDEYRLNVPPDFSIESAFFAESDGVLMCRSRSGEIIRWDLATRERLPKIVGPQDVESREFERFSDRTVDGLWQAIPADHYVRLIHHQDRSVFQSTGASK